jgi:hypothetical protein
LIGSRSVSEELEAELAELERAGRKSMDGPR